MLASLALAFLAAPSPAAPVKAAPMTVRVETAATADAAAQAWASDLRTALAARKDEFRLAKPGERAEFVVRIDSVDGAQDGTSFLNGALVLGEAKRSFRYSFTNVRAEAEKLARNLRKVADQMKAGAK